MTIDEAIEITKGIRETFKSHSDPKFKDALQLDIEGLNEIMRFRNGKDTRDLWRLKGETEK